METYKLANKFCCKKIPKDKTLGYNNKYDIKIKDVRAEPDNINWENLELKFGNKCRRAFFVGLFTFILLVIPFALQLVGKS